MQVVMVCIDPPPGSLREPTSPARGEVTLNNECVWNRQWTF
jgi:hypothetical protein